MLQFLVPERQRTSILTPRDARRIGRPSQCELGTTELQLQPREVHTTLTIPYRIVGTASRVLRSGGAGALRAPIGSQTLLSQRNLPYQVQQGGVPVCGNFTNFTSLYRTLLYFALFSLSYFTSHSLFPLFLITRAGVWTQRGDPTLPLGRRPLSHALEVLPTLPYPTHPTLAYLPHLWHPSYPI